MGHNINGKITDRECTLEEEEDPKWGKIWESSWVTLAHDREDWRPMIDNGGNQTL